ncbi:hypothetical protein [Streptomyces sp. PsTaAH-124]|uniref:hypothetical protein n=1 Tax=Streptomyces sp. PsTaAH-124 TaxID=1157638 RepID=UPI00131A4003|nr:hypothetical protein [Streptomyces sp. PsTaAH-124]
MAEISYPFDADNANGGTKVVSQTQWQTMALAWTSDRVDFPLVNTSYTTAQLPFSYSFSGRTLTVNAGSAWVGGFYYRLTGSKQFTIADNNTAKDRRDLVVLRADMANSSVNMAVIQGTPATTTTPTEPTPTRQPGGVWEMPVLSVSVPANNGPLSANARAPYTAPPVVAYPWNVPDSTALLPKGSIAYDLDSNGGDSQFEAFNGRDGYVVTRHFGRSRNYTPNLLYTNGTVPVANRRGRWRWIAPNMFWFQITIQNDYEDKGISVSGSNKTIGVTLPQISNPDGVQVLPGSIWNTYYSGGYPNMMQITAHPSPGSSTLYLYTPNVNTLKEGLDSLVSIPARSSLNVSGVVEANQYPRTAINAT